MFPKQWPVWMIVVSWILWPGLVHSQEAGQPISENIKGSVTLGGAGVSLNRESFKFGEYTGIEDTGGYFVGDADLTYTRENYYADFFVDNLGLENRHVYFEAGQMGNYSAFAEFDQQPHLLSNTGQTSYQGVGGTNLTGGSSTGPFQAFDQDTDTDTIAFGVKKTIGEDKELFLSYRRVEKDGIQDLGATFDDNGGGFANPTILPEAVDQVTNEVRASLAHNGEKMQVKLEYFLSLFDNKNESISFNNPFAAGDGLISREPDNTYHKLSLSGGMNLSPTTRITGIAEYGRMRQNDELLPFATTSAAAAPRKNADALIQTIHLGMKLAMRPSSKLSVGANYRYYQTINDTPSELFLYIKNDDNTAPAQVAANSRDALFTQPYDYIQNKAGVFAAYRAPLSTTLKLNYDVDWRNRDQRAVEHTVEQTFKGSARFGHLDFMDAYVHATYANRRGDKYDSRKVFNTRHSADFVSTAGLTVFDENKDLAQSDISNRERFKYGADLNFFPFQAQDMTFGLSYYYIDDDYPNTTLGLTESTSHNISIDASYAGKYETFFVYYSFDDRDSQLKGRPTNADLNTNYQIDTDDVTHTIGVGGKLGFMQNKFWVGADYSYSQTITDFNFITSSGSGAGGPLDDIQATLHTVKLNSFYKLDDNIDVGVKYKGQRYDADNFFTDGVSPTSPGSVLFLGGSNPNYYAHLGLVYATYYFGGRD